MTLYAPVPLGAQHRVSGFSCGETVLDDWLKRRALPNQTTGASRTFVVADEDGAVFGYYALATGAIAHQDAVRNLRRNMPDPVPVMILARLAVDLRARGQKLGAALLQDALKRTLLVSAHAGVRALIVHSLNERARAFYEYYGFRASPIDPMTLMLGIPAPAPSAKPSPPAVHSPPPSPCA